MSTERKNTLRQVFTLAWQFIKRNGLTLSEALRIAWRNAKLRTSFYKGIVKFTFQKVDGTLRQAFGTLADHIVPTYENKGVRKPNDTLQVYYDTEKNEFRSFKKLNLLTIG